MKRRWLVRLVMFGMGVSAAGADVLDDLGVTERQFASGFRFPVFDGRGTKDQTMLDLSISDAHATGVEVELVSQPGSALVNFYESRGEFAKALESGATSPLARIRLLFRAGRLEEARAALAGEDFRSLAESLYPTYLLQPACRPLEDAQAWDDLRGFLRLLAERLTSPAWRVALWAEELDIAWHLDRVPALLEEAANDPQRLAVLHHRLGNLEERDRLATGLLENASPAKVTELLGVLKDCPATRKAAMDLWSREDLAVEERVALFDQLSRLPQVETVDELLRAWVVKGGDAMPLADLIWRRWLATQSGYPQRYPVLAALHQRHPNEPRFQLLLARKLIEEDPAKAAELFEKAAAGLPLTAAKDPLPVNWLRNDLWNMPANQWADLPFFAIHGLGMLNRQDRVRAVLDRQAGWTALPRVDQVRYLAAGKMDFEVVKLTTGADFSKPENDVLASWLKAFLEMRLSERVLPRELAGEIVSKFDALVAGSAEKSGRLVTKDASELLEMLGSEEVQEDVWRESVGRLVSTIKGRDGKQVDILDARIRSAGTRHPRLKGLIPDGDKPATPSTASKDFSKGMNAMRWLTLFSPPQIRRIVPFEGAGRFDPRGFGGGFGGQNRGLPLELLDRWCGSGDLGAMDIPGVARPLGKDDQAILQSLMRHFAAGNPRRLLAEILIAKGLLDSGDETLKAESQASVVALMAGEKEARGTEAFIYATLVETKPNEDELRKVLAKVKGYPPSVRGVFLRKLQTGQLQNRPQVELARRELGLTDPQPGREKTNADGNIAKFNELARQKLMESPQAVELATQLLDQEVMHEIDPSYQQWIFSAATVLEVTGTLDHWLQNAREKLLQSGIPEAEVLRRLRRVDQRQSPDQHSRSLDYSRKILALDPTDVGSARQLLPLASADGDRKLLLTCVRAMGVDGLSQLARAEVLSTFGKEEVAEVFTIVREQNLNGRLPGSDTVGELHGYFLAADPEVAVEFRGWLAARGLPPSVSRLAFAGQLLDAGRQDEAVDLIARAFVTPAKYPGFPHQFPPKPGLNSKQTSSSWDVSVLEPDLAFLRERKLFAPVIARIEDLGSADPIAVATFRLAATPDTATFERHALPLLDKSKGTYRGALIQNWIELFRKQPGTTVLGLRLLEEKSKTEDEWELSQFAYLVRSAAGLPGGSRLMAELWPRMTKAAVSLEDPEKKEALTVSMNSVLLPMLGSADDDTWRSYWSWRESNTAPLGNLNYLPFAQMPAGFIDPARLRQILPRVLGTLDGKLPAAPAAGLALAAVATGDRALVEKVKAAIPSDHRAAIELCDLGLGDTTAVAPMLGTAPEENGETLLWWNFVGVAPVDKKGSSRDIPRCPFPTLDGKLDLQITAGSQPDRQVIIRKLPASAAAGHVRLKLAPEQRYVALLAIEPTTGVERWTDTLDTQSSTGLPLPLSDGELAGRGFQRLGWDGPGGLPAWKIRFSGRERVDLLERPWNGSGPVTFGAWVSGEGKLELRCLDASGREMHALALTAWDAPLPVWQFHSIRVPEKFQFAAETVRLVLSTSAHGHNDGPLEFAISNVRLEIGPPAALPAGFERITRLPGATVSLALSPDAKQLAVSLRSGKLVIVDLVSRELQEIPTAHRGSEGRVTRMTSTAAGIYALQGDGSLYRLDEQNRKLDRVLPLRRGNPQSDISSFRVSDDGKWVVWRDNDRRVMLASTDGDLRREISSSPSIRFELTEEGIRLIDERGRQSLLKAADFRTGEPVEVAGPAPQTPEQHPIWKNRLRFTRNPVEPGTDIVRIPAARESAVIATDGTIYYVDESGHLIRVTP